MYFSPILYLWRDKMNQELERVINELENEVLEELNKSSEYEQLKRLLENKLIKYLNHYINKGFRMNQVFNSIHKTLISESEISEKQFQSIIKFIEKEKEFKGLTKMKIFHYFSPIINLKNKKIGVSNLEDFFDTEPLQNTKSI